MTYPPIYQVTLNQQQWNALLALTGSSTSAPVSFDPEQWNALLEAIGNISTGGGGGGSTPATDVIDNSAAQVTDSIGDTLAFVSGNPTTIEHDQIPAISFHQTFHYEQTTDPGAVGAGKWWADTTTATLKRRNAGNTAWEIFL